jgi:hypothetical protein
VGNRRAPPIAACLILAACTFPALATPTPTLAPTPTPAPTPTASPSPIPSPTPEPTPGAADVPSFIGGELIETTIDGMRVRQRPGTDSRVIAGLLPLNARLEVVMGPILNDGIGWYLVRESDERDLGFGEGWIAAGFEPEPFLATTGSQAPGSLTAVGLAGTGNAEHGPVTIDADAEYAIRWVAADPERTGCSYAVFLSSGGGDPVPAIRATIGDDLVPGTLQSNAFDALGQRGLVFLTVASDCAWTLAIVRIPEATPEPSPSG